MDLLLVGVGGILGSLARFQLGKVISEKAKTSFPIATFLINITGAFMLGLVSRLNVDKNFLLLFANGFLGAYTTFSTFMYEGFNLFQGNKKMNAFVYIIGSLAVGVAGYSIAYFW